MAVEPQHLIEMLRLKNRLKNTFGKGSVNVYFLP